jgi:hypothetical protein
LEELLKTELSPEELKELETNEQPANPTLQSRPHETGAMQFFRDLQKKHGNCCCEPIKK